MNTLPIKIVVTGAAGLVGREFITRLKAAGYCEIVAIDKHPANTKILRTLHPHVRVIETDLASADGWEATVAEADVIVVAQAQIGGLDRAAFVANNITATERLIKAVRCWKPPARCFRRWHGSAAWFMVGNAFSHVPRGKMRGNRGDAQGDPRAAEPARRADGSGQAGGMDGDDRCRDARLRVR